MLNQRNNPSKRHKKNVDSDSSDSDGDIPMPAPNTAEEPWKREFNRYIKGEDELGDKTTLIQWWGVRNLYWLYVFALIKLYS